jgi:hypothetical protein
MARRQERLDRRRISRKNAGMPATSGTAVRRLLEPPPRSFFLFGPRGGVDTWRADDGIEVMSVARFTAELARGL